MTLSLIKQLNESIREKDEYELALEKAGIKSQPVQEDHGLPYEDDFARLADQYRDADMSTSELIDALGNDFEMLEYTPDDTERGIDAVLQMLGRELTPEENEEEDIEMYDEPAMDDEDDLSDYGHREEDDTYDPLADEREGEVDDVIDFDTVRIP